MTIAVIANYSTYHTITSYSIEPNLLNYCAVVSLELRGRSILKKINTDQLDLIQFHAKLILAVDAVDKRSVQNAPLSFKVFDFSSASPGLEKQTNQRGKKQKINLNKVK